MKPETEKFIDDLNDELSIKYWFYDDEDLVTAVKELLQRPEFFALENYYKIEWHNAENSFPEHEKTINEKFYVKFKKQWGTVDKVYVIGFPSSKADWEGVEKWAYIPIPNLENT